MTMHANQRLTTISDELRREGEVKGIAKGVRQARIDIAGRLLELGMNDKQILSITRLTDGELDKIKTIRTNRL